jgi:group I intron endonuclease
MANAILAQGGIYAIRNTVNGKLYIGSAGNIERRFSQHRYSLKQGEHHTKALQNAWLKYGAEAFVFEVIERVSDCSQLVKIEQQWIDRLGSVVPGGYNIRPIAESCRGIKHSAEVVEANRLRQLGRKASAETRAKMSEARKGREVSEETRQKIRKSNAGKKFGPQTEAKRAATSKAMTGIPKDAAWRARLSKAHASLNDDQVRMIRALKVGGMSVVKIAENVGASVSVTSNVCIGRSYKHVTA